LLRFCPLAVAFSALTAAAGCSTLFPGSSNSGAGLQPAPLTGCPSTPSQPTAPGGYYVNGNNVCTPSGQPHIFHGVDRPSLEWSQAGDHLSAADFQLMGTWKANLVRIALNQDFWLSGSQYYSANYATTVDAAVAWAEEAGMDVMLDLHWSDQGTLGSCNPSGNCQQNMADVNSITFWSEVAARYMNDGRILFELYNEPHDVTWSVWKSGGMGGGFMVAGMQQLYKAVRDTGANNLVVIGGLDFAYDLSGVPGNRIDGYNILYATHPYNNSAEKNPKGWDSHFGFLTATDPVLVTEFGDSSTCDPTYTQELIAYADKFHAGWTAWAWYVGGCGFPSIIGDWSGTPTMTGAAVKAALQGYGEPAVDGRRDSGTSSATDGGSETDAATDGGSPATDAGESADAGRDASSGQ
jgi:endoglucanase